MTASEFRALFDRVSNWGRWDDARQRGALNLLTPAKVQDAARLVRSGVTVTLSRALTTEARIDVPEPADHHMTMLTDEDIGSGSGRLAKDYVGVCTTRGTRTSTPSAMWRSRARSSTAPLRPR
jgi:hypothetical protein